MKTVIGQIIVITCDGPGCHRSLRTHCNSNAKKYVRAMGWMRCTKQNGEANQPRRYYCHRCRVGVTE